MPTIRLSSVSSSIFSVIIGAKKPVHYRKLSVSKYFFETQTSSVLIIEFSKYVNDTPIEVLLTDLRFEASGTAPATEADALTALSTLLS